MLLIGGPGGRACSYAEDLLDAGLIRVTEMWDDLAALEAHIAIPHVAEWRAARPALGIRDRDFTLYEVASSAPTSDRGRAPFRVGSAPSHSPTGARPCP